MERVIIDECSRRAEKVQAPGLSRDAYRCAWHCLQAWTRERFEKRLGCNIPGFVKLSWVSEPTSAKRRPAFDLADGFRQQHRLKQANPGATGSAGRSKTHVEDINYAKLALTFSPDVAGGPIEKNVLATALKHLISAAGAQLASRSPSALDLGVGQLLKNDGFVGLRFSPRFAGGHGSDTGRARKVPGVHFNMARDGAPEDLDVSAAPAPPVHVPRHVAADTSAADGRATASKTASADHRNANTLSPRRLHRPARICSKRVAQAVVGTGRGTGTQPPEPIVNWNSGYGSDAGRADEPGIDFVPALEKQPREQHHGHAAESHGGEKPACRAGNSRRGADFVDLPEQEQLRVLQQMGYAPDVLAGIRELEARKKASAATQAEVAARRDKALLQGGDGSSLQGLGGKDGGKDMALVVGQGTRLLINLNKGKKMVDPSKALVGPDAGDVKPAGVASGVADFDPEAAAFSYGGKGRLIMSKRAVQKRVVGFDEAAERSYGAAVLKQTEQEQRDAEREALEAKKLSEHRVKLERRAHDLQAKSDAARRAYHQELRAAVAETEQKKYAAVAARIGQVRSSQQKMAPAVAPGDENLTAGAAGAGLPGQRDEGKEATEKRLKEKLYRIELAKQIQANREEKARANLDRVRGERAALAEMEAMQVGSVLDARRAKVEQQQAVDAMLTVAGLGKGRTHEGL